MAKSLITRLNERVAEFDLLRHPFYQRWNEGTLTVQDLQIYAQQYYYFVREVPTLVSAIHSNCRNQPLRLSILENLVEEETGGDNMVPHEDLWVWFANGIGMSSERLSAADPTPETRKLLLTYRNLCKSSNCAVGAAAMYAYESRIPEISETKLYGLKKHYGIRDEETLRFFREHMVADIEHTKTWANVMDTLCKSSDDREQAADATAKAAKALWQLLDGVCESCNIPINSN